MGRPTKMIVDTSALRHNLSQVRALAPQSSILAMVKANAYGHGIQRVAHALSGADALGVACIEEALLLRSAKVFAPIVLMEGLFSREELNEASLQKLTLVVHHFWQVEMLEKEKVPLPLHVWLKINTGMNRLGFGPGEAGTVCQRLQACASVAPPIGAMSHFAQAEDADHTVTLQQIERFKAATQSLKGPKSLANSAGILAWPNAHQDWVRPGLVLYGASPFRGKIGLDHGLRPAMTLASEIIGIQKVFPGEGVGYGGEWRPTEEKKIGVVAVGYGDGYPQFMKQGTPVLVNGTICPLVGRVSMDMLSVDLSGAPHVQLGDPVVLWGEGLPVERVAEHNNTSAYELLARITPRVQVSPSS